MTGFYYGASINYSSAVIQQYADAIEKLKIQLRDCSADEQHRLLEEIKAIENEREKKLKQSRHLFF